MEAKPNNRKRIFKIITNTYLIILTFFVIWMLFIDENSFLYHQELDQEIRELEKWNEYHRKKIADDREVIKKLQDSLELERYARENYLMKKENEDIYIIEFDTIKK